MLNLIKNLSLQDWSQIFTIVGVVAAITVYIMNSLAQRRQRSIDNALRYMDCHSKLFTPDGYCMSNVKAMEKGTYKRDLQNKEMEIKFNEFLSTCEHLALLHMAGGTSKSINAYMIGWYAKHICPILTDREKAEPYWELAIDFLKETKRQAEKLDGMSKEDRLKYLSKNHFKYL